MSGQLIKLFQQYRQRIGMGGGAEMPNIGVFVVFRSRQLFAGDVAAIADVNHFRNVAGAGIAVVAERNAAGVNYRVDIDSILFVQHMDDITRGTSASAEAKNQNRSARITFSDLANPLDDPGSVIELGQGGVGKTVAMAILANALQIGEITRIKSVNKKNVYLTLRTGGQCNGRHAKLIGALESAGIDILWDWMNPA